MKLFTLVTTAFAATANAEISYQHIRNATAKIEMAGNTFLVDPYLAPKGSYAGFEGTINSQKRNPLIDMAEPVDKVLQGVDAVIVTHTHADHWDEYAQKVLPKTLPVFVQNAGDAQIIRSQGFKDVRVVGKNTEFNKVKLSKTGGQHGTDQMYSVPQLAERLGEAMGVVMQADGAKTLYIVGDTIWNEEVDFALNRYKPEVIVMNTGYAQLEGNSDSIIMGKADVAKARQVAPKAEIITVHMDAVNHASVTSDEMRKFVKENNLSKVAVPKESEVLKY
ncbi:MBL fold metallo-hydrolase [Rodentibacter caecimuris]|uniref:MBL fold metallo-hydrolase n=1 Tax=Rodentibacter caecimuris TaxID=1796644 RepID=UPI001094B089|nr:MBL fold metallo-hydrolase [Pasteurella caecimuris]MCR1836589.1 MBL fold metallo-hydrolase [Pasteurella caecimuris]MCU0106979.1 MBL fold metallo-hydrolase [Pasteurella caecimuris]TGY48685.1 MBL fold metallo-hydrolase [Pasteurella caecimuris]